MEPVFRRLCLAHETLILPVMQSFLRFLGSDPHLYDQKLTRTNFGQRLNYYPPLSPDDEASGAGRMLGHEDVDLFTFLPAPGVEGLQVLNRANMKWIRLCAPPGTLILNTGDYMQRISNDILPSTTHRVSLPRERGGATRGPGLACPWPSTSGKTRSSRCCPASACRSTSRSRPCSSTRRSRASTTATTTPSKA